MSGRLCRPVWATLMAGATLIMNLSASDEVVGKMEYRRSLIAGQSARLLCGYLYADAGQGENPRPIWCLQAMTSSVKTVRSWHRQSPLQAV